MKVGRLKVWRDLGVYTLVEAALLIIENYPDEFINLDRLLEKPPQDFLPVYKDLLNSATSILDEGEQEGGGFYMENELTTNKPSKVKALTLKGGVDILVTHDELLRYVTTFKIAARFLTDETLTEFGGSEVKSSIDDNRPLIDAEREALLRLVAALAVNGYKYPNRGAQAEILKDFQNNANGVAENTLSKYLAEAKQYIPQPK